MTRGSRLTKIKFLSINRDIKAAVAANAYRSADIASKHGVSTETVRQVKNAKTWPGFVTAKQHKAAKAASIKADKFERAQKAGLKPVSSISRKEKRAGDEITVAIESPYVTRGELREEIRAVHSRVDVLSDGLRGLNRDPLFRVLFGRRVRAIIAQRDESKEAA